MVLVLTNVPKPMVAIVRIQNNGQSVCEGLVRQALTVVELGLCKVNTSAKERGGLLEYLSLLVLKDLKW